MDSVSAGGDPMADNVDVVVPVLVNAKDLAKGDELRVLWTRKPAAKQEKTSKITWASQARVKIGKQQQKGQK